MSHLFSPLTLRGLTLRNRIAVSPMCQYSSIDGFATDWHLVHLGSRAVGGAGLVMLEASAVDPVGRITPEDLGIWKREHVEMLGRIARFIRAHGAAAGIQLAHAGRKASRARPWEQDGAVPESDGGWQPVGPSAIPFAEGWRVPSEMSAADIARTCEAFAAAARLAVEAGFDLIELHAAHGYLCHSFYSPISNTRTDGYGGSFEGRIRFTVEALRALRGAWPDDKPISVRLSATDWVDGGWTPVDTVRLASELKSEGADLVDCSSGGNVARAVIPVGPGYQVPFAERVRRDAGIPTGAVGLITAPAQADEIVRNGRADLVLLAREEIRDPYWPVHAAQALGQPVQVPVQYLRGYHGATVAPSLVPEGLR